MLNIICIGVFIVIFCFGKLIISSAKSSDFKLNQFNNTGLESHRYFNNTSVNEEA